METTKNEAISLYVNQTLLNDSFLRIIKHKCRNIQQESQKTADPIMVRTIIKKHYSLCLKK